MSSSVASDPFASLRNPRYLRLWIAGTFSFMSVQMQLLVRGLLAWDLTLRESALGTVYLFFGVGLLVATPLGGVAADRISKQRLLLAAQSVLTVVAMVMGVLVVTDAVQFWHLGVSASLQGMAFGFYGPARVAYAAEIVGRDQLANAITLSLLSMNGTRVFAPSLAGALAGVALVGIGGVYLIGAAFSLMALLSLVGLPARTPTPSGRNALLELVDGVRYVGRIPRLRRLVVLSLVTIMFGFNYVSFMPALVKGAFDRGDAAVGIAMSASAVGAVLVAIPVASFGDGPMGHRLMIVAGLLFGVAVATLSISGEFWVALIVIALAGAATTTFQSLSNSIALGWAEDQYQGRVQSLMMLAFAGFGLAALPLGFLAEAIGLETALAVMGAVTLAASIAYAVTSWSEDPAGLETGAETTPTSAAEPAPGPSVVR